MCEVVRVQCIWHITSFLKNGSMRGLAYLNMKEKPAPTTTTFKPMGGMDGIH